MDFTEILKVILLGVVEGITEWLPISSTGHMILVDEFVKLNVSEAFREMFFVVIQLGAIFAVIVLYWSKLFPFKKQKIADAKARIVLDRETMLMWLKVIIAVLPAALIGIPFDDQIDAMFYNYQTVAVTLILYGVLFIVIETRNRGKLPRINSIENITYGTAIIIGIFQVLSLIPGTSRSGATIVGAILIGVSRTVAAEFTFFSCHTCHAGSKPPQACQVRAGIHAGRGSHTGCRDDYGLRGFDPCHQIPDGLYKEARF